MDQPGTNLEVEDVLTYLPRRPLVEFARGSVIYDAHQPSGSLYLVVSGRVKVSTTAEDGVQTIVRIVVAEGLFGEGSLIGQNGGPEHAVALDNVTVMAWPATAIEAQIDRQPSLGIALAQYLVARCLELEERIASMALYKTPERVAIAMLQLAASQSQHLPVGVTRIPALTHQLIAEFVGTSREIVTFQMNRMRREGLLDYSRSYIDINVPAIRAALKQVSA